MKEKPSIGLELEGEGTGSAGSLLPVVLTDPGGDPIDFQEERVTQPCLGIKKKPRGRRAVQGQAEDQGVSGPRGDESRGVVASEWGPGSRCPEHVVTGRKATGGRPWGSRARSRADVCATGRDWSW